MDKEGKKRLLKLADLLHDHSRGRRMTIPGDGRPRFDLSAWIRDEDCGTAACAVGSAMLSPWFQQRGLRTVRVKAWTGTIINAPAFGRKKEFDAVSAFFGVDIDDAMNLFHPLRYGPEAPTPKQVAKRIRALVASQQLKP